MSSKRSVRERLEKKLQKPPDLVVVIASGSKDIPCSECGESIPPGDMQRSVARAWHNGAGGRLDSLLDRNSDGVVTQAEKAELEGLVAEAEKLMVANAKRLADFARSNGAEPPEDAVPVTVWVKPETVGP